jgi:hypothetical protein
MKKPLVNDFGTGFVSRDKARVALVAHGWSTTGKKWVHQAWHPKVFTLRQAWAWHTGVSQ